jgi:hypothetical protein
MLIQLERDQDHAHEFNELYKQIDELRREIEKPSAAE